MKIKGVFIFLFLFLIFTSLNLNAAFFDPSAGWKTISTKHFRIHYPARMNAVANQVANIAEEEFPGLVERWDWKPWGYIEVVITDDKEYANGLALIFPYNAMLLWVTPPTPDSSLANYDDWLRTLISHELTHIIQLDGARGFWRVPRVIFGKIIAPSSMDPTWMKEGIAQFEESRLTYGGRARGSYSEMVVRTSVIEDNFPKIDEVDGFNWKWPGASGAYIYGLKFIDYIITKYGEDKFHQFDLKVRASPLIFSINRQANKVFGKSFYKLWKEWHEELVARYAGEKIELERIGLTELTEVVEQVWDSQLGTPVISPDGKKLVYSYASPHKEAEIRIRDLESGRETRVAKNKFATSFSWNKESTKILYATPQKYKRYYRYYDIWQYDLEKRSRKRLTKGLNGRDPVFSNDGKSVIYIESDNMTDVISIFKLPDDGEKDWKADPMEVLIQEGARFANPQLSPDGKRFAISKHDGRNGWRIYLYDVDGRNEKRMTVGEGVVVESYPFWSRDGKKIYFSSDVSSIANIYEHDLKSGKTRKITNVKGGLFQPSTSDDKRIYVKAYNSKGFYIGSFDLGATYQDIDLRGNLDGLYSFYNDEKVTFSKERTVAEAGKGAQVEPKSSGDERQEKLELKSDKYVSFGRSLFLPRFITPTFAYSNNEFFIGGLTGGTDPLMWHRWTAAVDYRTVAKDLELYFDYMYNRFRPVLGAGFYQMAVSKGRLRRNNEIYFENYRTGYGAIAYPFGKFSASLGYYFSDHTPKTYITPGERAALNLGYFAGINVAGYYSDYKVFPAAISQEDGRKVSINFTLSDAKLGAAENNEQIIFMGDWREYIEIWKHHAVALRAMGGMTWNDDLQQNTFVIGGSSGEGMLAANLGNNYFPLRGLPYSSFGGNRGALFSSEYRFPIISPQRGLGTTPLFMKSLSAALFADYGDVWFNYEPVGTDLFNFFDRFMLGIGAEIRGMFIIGHGLPIEGRLGYGVIAVNRSRLGILSDPITGADAKYGVMVLEFGTSF